MTVPRLKSAYWHDDTLKSWVTVYVFTDFATLLVLYLFEFEMKLVC